MEGTIDSDKGSPLSSLRRHLEDWDVVSASSLLSSSEHVDWLSDHSWEVVPLVAEYLTQHHQSAGPHLVHCCQQLLVTCAEVGNPKENLIAFLEQMDGVQDEVRVRRCLPGLGLVLAKIKDKSKSLSWAWALSTVFAQVKRLVAVPDNAGLEGAERMSADLGEAAVAAHDMVTDVATFVEPLVDLVSFDNNTGGDDDPGYADMTRKRRVLRHFLVQLLGHPLTFINLHPEVTDNNQTVEPAGYQPAKIIVRLIADISSDMVRQVIVMDLDKVGESVSVIEEEEVLERTAVGAFLYLVLGEGLFKDRLPSVYTSTFLLQQSSPHVTRLLENKHEMCVHKGLLLLNNLLEHVPDGVLGVGESDNPYYRSLVKPLVSVIVYHDLKELRSLGFQCYRRYVSMFSPDGRYTVYLDLLHSVKHSGLRGWTITSLKDTIAGWLSQPGHGQASPYTGPSLHRLVADLLVLPEQERTDLLDASDEVQATVNMLIYLLVRDKEDKTGVRGSLLGDVEKYVEQLETGVRLARAHYELQLREMDTSGGGGGTTETSVTVGGRELPQLDPTKKRQVMRSALITFDMIQFNLVRLKSLLEGKHG